ncbi:MAG: rRNA maturation RNase YbeY [Pseudomonadota bacterium]
MPDLEDLANSAAEMAFSDVSVPLEVAVLACEDARIAALNADFRGKDRATNVLSWPAFSLTSEVPGQRPAPLPESAAPGPVTVGDVAIALQTCVSEAKNAGIPLKNHVLHLILHGCLHLLGYDHIHEADAALMEGLETRLLLRAGYPDPYA